MAKENAHNEQFFILPQLFQLYSMNLLLFIEIIPIFADMFLRLSAAYVLYVGKG